MTQRVAAIPALATLCSGCALNTSPIHSELDKAEVSARVRESFHAGMPTDEVKLTLRGLRLDYAFETMPQGGCDGAGPHGFVAYVEKPGFRWTIYPSWSANLRLWLDGHDHLACVDYVPHDAPEAWRIVP